MNTQVLEHRGGRDAATVDFERRMSEARKWIYRVALRSLGNPSDAEDVVQETMVRAWYGIRDFDPWRSFNAWIGRIAINLCVDHLRRRRRRVTEISMDGA